MFHRFRQATRALRSRNLRLFFAGQATSAIGSWMQHVAMGWLAYRLTGSTVALGFIAFAGQFPSVVLSPLAGVLADRVSRYRMVVASQLLGMAQAAVTAGLVVTGVVQVWHLYVLAAVLGIAKGVDIPARQALLVRLVDEREDLPNAIALNSSIFNAARIIGAGVAGLLIAGLGEGPVFVINAMSYVAVLAALFSLRLKEPIPTVKGSVLNNLVEGIRYARSFKPLGGALLLLLGISIVGMPYSVLLPAFASDVLGGGSETLGALTGATGVGALAGALHLASRGSVVGLGRLISQTTGVFGISLVAFALSRSPILSGAILVVTGASLLTTTASINTVLQTLVDEEKRGRIMSLYTMAMLGGSSLGGVLGGAIARTVGAPIAVAAAGLGCMILSAWFTRLLPGLRAMVRPVYQQMGILEEVATGLGKATNVRPQG
ncbi:MAG: MFS transporter [Longimicrobiales bacterium]